MADEIPPLLQSYNLEPKLKPGVVDALIAEVQNLAKRIAGILGKIDIGPITVDASAGNAVKGQFSGIEKAITSGFDEIQKRLESGIGAALDVLVQKAIAAQTQINKIPGGGGGSREAFGPGVPERQSQSARSQELEKQRIFENADKVRRELLKRQQSQEEDAANRRAQAESKRLSALSASVEAEHKARQKQAADEKKQEEDVLNRRAQAESKRLSALSASVEAEHKAREKERIDQEKADEAALLKRNKLIQNRAALATKQREEEQKFQSGQPTRVASAQADVTNTVKQQTQAENLLAAARKESAAAAKSTDPARRAAALNAERAAIQAVTDATNARLAAENKLRVVSDPTSTKKQVEAANQLAATTAKQATASNGLAREASKAAEGLKPLGKNGREAHEQLLALLGVSRFLPGALGQALSGVALLSGGMQSATGVFIGVAGSIATVIIQLGRMGAQFNEELNKQRAQAEGLGLTLTEVKAFQLVLGQTGGTIENFAVGIKKINEAVTGIGDNAVETKNLLGLVFAGTGFDFTKVTASIEKGSASKQILLELAKNMRTLEKAGLGSAVAAQIFGRSWDEVKGRLQDIADKEELFEKALKDSGITSKEAEQSAKDYAQVVAELELAWTKFAATLGGPVTAVLKGFQVSLNFLTEDAETTLNRIKGFIKKGEIDTANQLASEIRELKRAQDVAESAGKAGDLKGTISGTSVDEDVNFRDPFVKKNLGQRIQQQIDIRTERLKGLGFDSEQLIQQKEAQEQAVKDETAITENQKKLREERQKQLEEAGKSASLTERTATQKEHELAVAQDEQQLLQKQRQEEEKSLKLAETILQGDISDTKRADITEKRNAAKNRLIGLRIEENRLGKKIAALRKEERPTAALEAEAEDINEALRSTDRSSAKFQVLADKLLATRKKILSLARTPDETRRFSKDLFRDTQFIKGQTLDELQQQFSASLVKIQEESAQALDTINQTRQRTIVETDKALEAGSITVTEAARRDTQAILDVLNIATIEFNKKRDAILGQITKVEALKAAGKIRPDEADKATERLQADLSAARIKQFKQEATADTEIVRTDDATTKKLIRNRQDLLAIEISTQEAINRRRIDLLQRAAQDSIDLQERAAIEIRDNDIKINEAEQARLLTQFNDRRDLIVKTVTETVGGLQEASRVATNAFLGGLASGKPAQVLKTFKEIGIRELSELQEAVKNAVAQGADISPEFLTFLREIIALKQKALDIDQTSQVTLQDLAIKKATELLNIHRQDNELAFDLLNFQQERLGFLKQEGLIGIQEANQRQVEIEKQRLKLIQDQVQEIQRRAQVRTAEVVQRNEALPPDQRRSISAVIASVQASPEISELQRELVKLGAESIATSDRIRLLDSVLGRVRSGLDILIDAFDKAPDKFDEFSTAILKRSLKGLGDAARGVQKLVDIIIGKDLTRKDPATELSLAATSLKSEVVKAASDFRDIILQAATDFKSGAAAPPAGSAADLIHAAGHLTGSDQVKKSFGDNVKSAVSKAFTVAGGIISGLSAETIGGKIAGFGQIAGAFGPIGQAVAAGAQIIGGIADFIGAGFRKKAEKIAKDIQTNIALINDKFKNGAITLGQSISGLSAQLTSARSQLGSGKIGKKGGRAALAELEKDINGQIADLRRQARETQENFSKALELLRLPTDFRNPFTTLSEAVKTIKDFLNSFENANDAVAHFADAEDFLTLSVKELRSAAEAFEKSRRDLLNQGRVKTIFDEAKDRLAQLFELERKRAEEQLKAQQELAKQRGLLDFIDSIFKRFKTDLDNLFATFRSPQLVDGLDAFASNVNRLAGSTGRIADVSTGLAGTSALQTQQAQVNLSGAINVNVSASSPADAVRQISAGLQSTLSKINPFAGWLPSARPVNP